MVAKVTTILALALSAGICASANASVIDNTVQASGDTALGVNSNSAAESFVATSSNLGDLLLDLDVSASGSTGSIVITIRNTNGTKVGSTIEDTIQTLSNSQLPVGTETLFDFYNLGITNLSVGTEYYVSVNRVGSTLTDAQVFTNTAAPIVGIASTGSSAGDTDFASGSGNGVITKLMDFCVSTGNTCDGNSPSATYSFNESPAPEPASLAVVGAGLAGLGWVRRRRSPKS